MKTKNKADSQKLIFKKETIITFQLQHLTMGEIYAGISEAPTLLNTLCTSCSGNFCPDQKPN